MIKVIEKTSRCYCKFCDADSIDCYNIYNKPLNYNILLSRFSDVVVLDRLNITPLSHMKCSKCGRVYIISWIDGILPTPLYVSPTINDTKINRM